MAAPSLSVPALCHCVPGPSEHQRYNSFLSHWLSACRLLARNLLAGPGGLAMGIHSGRDSGDRVWSYHCFLSHGLAARGELAAERRARLDHRAVEPGKTSEATSSV